jgi:hypothetical protein
MEAEFSFETLASTYTITRRHYSEYIYAVYFKIKFKAYEDNWHRSIYICEASETDKKKPALIMQI